MLTVNQRADAAFFFMNNSDEEFRLLPHNEAFAERFADSAGWVDADSPRSRAASEEIEKMSREIDVFDNSWHDGKNNVG